MVIYSLLYKKLEKSKAYASRLHTFHRPATVHGHKTQVLASSSSVPAEKSQKAGLKAAVTAGTKIFKKHCFPALTWAGLLETSPLARAMNQRVLESNKALSRSLCTFCFLAIWSQWCSQPCGSQVSCTLWKLFWAFHTAPAAPCILLSKPLLTRDSRIQSSQCRTGPHRNTATPTLLVPAFAPLRAQL